MGLKSVAVLALSAASEASASEACPSGICDFVFPPSFLPDSDISTVKVGEVAIAPAFREFHDGVNSACATAGSVLTSALNGQPYTDADSATLPVGTHQVLYSCVKGDNESDKVKRNVVVLSGVNTVELKNQKLCPEFLDDFKLASAAVNKRVEYYGELDSQAVGALEFPTIDVQVHNLRVSVSSGGTLRDSINLDTVEVIITETAVEIIPGAETADTILTLLFQDKSSESIQRILQLAVDADIRADDSSGGGGGGGGYRRLAVTDSDPTKASVRLSYHTEDTAIDVGDVTDALEIVDPQFIRVKPWVMFNGDASKESHCTYRENTPGARDGEISTFKSTYDDKLGFLPEFYLPHCTWGQDFHKQGFTTYQIAWLDVCNHTFAVDPSGNEVRDPEHVLEEDGSTIGDHRLRIGPVTPTILDDCGLHSEDVTTVLYRCKRYHNPLENSLTADFLDPLGTDFTPTTPMTHYESTLLSKGWDCEHQEFEWTRNLNNLPILEAHGYNLTDVVIYRDYDAQDDDAKIQYDFTLDDEDITTQTCANLADESQFGRRWADPSKITDSSSVVLNGDYAGSRYTFTPTYEAECTRFPNATFMMGWGFKTSVEITDTKIVEGLATWQSYYNVTLLDAHIVSYTSVTGAVTSNVGNSACANITNSSAVYEDPALAPFGKKSGYDGKYLNVFDETRDPSAGLEIDKIVKNKFVITGQFEDQHIVDACGLGSVGEFESAIISMSISFVPYTYNDGDGDGRLGDGTVPQQVVNNPMFDVDDATESGTDQNNNRRLLRSIVADLPTRRLDTVITVRKAGSAPVRTAEIDVSSASLQKMTATITVDPETAATFDSTQNLQFGNTHFAQKFDELVDINGTLDTALAGYGDIYKTMEILDVTRIGSTLTKFEVDFQYRIQETDRDRFGTIIERAAYPISLGTDGSVIIVGTPETAELLLNEALEDALNSISQETGYSTLEDDEQAWSNPLIAAVSSGAAVGGFLLLYVIRVVYRKNTGHEHPYTLVGSKHDGGYGGGAPVLGLGAVF